MLFLLAAWISTQASQAATPLEVIKTDCVQITCPTNYTLYTCSDTTAVRTYPFGIDITCPGIPPSQFQVTYQCKPAPGAALGVGAHPVTCVALVNGQIVGQCGFVVTVVKDTTPPTIVCPNNITVDACPSPTGLCGAPVFYPAPIASDDSGNVSVNCVPPTGSFFTCGAHTVICTAFDRCQNESKCAFVVTVTNDGKPPTLQCPKNVTLLTCSNTAILKYPLPNVTPSNAVVVCNPPAGTPLGLGIHFVVCNASNACGQTSCEFPVIVAERPPATLLCPTNALVFTVPCNSNCVPVSYPAPEVLNGKLVQCIPPSGTCLPVGSHVVICEAVDSCDRHSRCEFVVRVIPGNGEPPIIHCLEPISVQTCQQCAVVKYPNPAVANGTLVACNPPSGTCFPVGISVVSCIASNACGKSECKFLVSVRASSPPVIQCPKDQVYEACGDCRDIKYPDPIVSNGALIGCNPPSGKCFPIGTTIVTCLASNECGRSECKFTITVRPKPAPQIQCPKDIVVTTCSDCEKVSFPDPTVINGTLIGCTPPSGKCFPVGTTIVTCLASNECGRAECKFTVTVRNTGTPVHVQCPDDVVVQTCGEGEVVDYPRPIVLPPSVDPSIVALQCNPPSGSFFPVGTNTVVCCVSNRCQERTCCEFRVIVHKGNPCVKPPQNMVLWLPFDEAFGLSAFNAVPGAPSGMHLNGPIPLLGQKVFNSLRFDGVDDFVAVPNYAAIMLNNSDLSIDAWVLRRDDGGRRVIVSKMGQSSSAAAPHGYEFYLSQGIMHLLLSGVAVQDFNSGTVVPLDNQWHHLVVTVRRSSGGFVRFFLDGIQVSGTPGPIVAPLGNSSRLHVGAATFPGPRDFFQGAIDEVEIFDRPLTQSEVTGLFQADRAGKCKVRCTIPWDVSYPTNGGCIQVTATICNFSVLPQTIAWAANGPMPIPAPNSGVVTLPPTTCTNIPITLCRPTNNVPVGEVVQWTLTVVPSTGCPQSCIGSVINPGPISTTAPDEIVSVPGTSQTVTVPVNITGLEIGSPVRLRAVTPSMEPDTENIRLNGLPPGVPWIVNAAGVGLASIGELSLKVPIQFAKPDSIGVFTILVETDVNGDGQYDTLRSFDVENPVVPPPSLSWVRGESGWALTWIDEGDGVLESSETLDGPWTPIPGARPGYAIKPTDKGLFFRVSVAVKELPSQAAE